MRRPDRRDKGLYERRIDEIRGLAAARAAVYEVKFLCFSGVPKMALGGPQTDVLGDLFGGSRGGPTKGENETLGVRPEPEGLSL